MGSVTPEKSALVAPKRLKISVYLLILPLRAISVAVRSSSPFLAATDTARR